jgi:hypothetical protein
MNTITLSWEDWRAGIAVLREDSHDAGHGDQHGCSDQGPPVIPRVS